MALRLPAASVSHLRTGRSRVTELVNVMAARAHPSGGCAGSVHRAGGCALPGSTFTSFLSCHGPSPTQRNQHFACSCAGQCTGQLRASAIGSDSPRGWRPSGKSAAVAVEEGGRPFGGEVTGRTFSQWPPASAVSMSSRAVVVPGTGPSPKPSRLLRKRNAGVVPASRANGHGPALLKLRPELVERCKM